MTRFLTRIELINFLNVGDMSITLSEEKPQHLIITGKNGSGKTQLIRRLRNRLSGCTMDAMTLAYPVFTPQQSLKSLREENRSLFDFLSDQSKGVLVELNEFEGDPYKSLVNLPFILLGAKRIFINQTKSPINIEEIDIYASGTHKDSINPFVLYLEKLFTDRVFAKVEGNEQLVSEIDSYIEIIQNGLGRIFELENLKLFYIREIKNFKITSDNNEPLTFDTLPDGFSAIFGMVSEIIMQTNSQPADNSLGKQAIVIIDEIETHLHIKLQKQILPFLIDFFPNIQFIVTTHSPFVITSVSNATVCDLENKIVTNDLSNYSYEAIIESYFDLDQYSKKLKDKIKRLESLLSKEKLTGDEKYEFNEIYRDVSSAPKYYSEELQSKLLDIRIDLELMKRKQS